MFYTDLLLIWIADSLLMGILKNTVWWIHSPHNSTVSNTVGDIDVRICATWLLKCVIKHLFWYEESGAGSRAGTSNYNPGYLMGCNYLSLLLIPVVRSLWAAIIWLENNYMDGNSERGEGGINLPLCVVIPSYHIRVLRITPGDSLKFDLHIPNTCKKAYRQINALKRMSRPDPRQS